MTLDQAIIGELIKISASADDKTKLKLSSLGLLQGDTIQVTAKAPFGGPICFKHQNIFCALRKSHAKKVLVEKVNS